MGTVWRPFIRQDTEHAFSPEISKRRRGPWAWVGISLLIAFAVLAVVAVVVVDHAGPLLKGRVIETLSTDFNSRVELDTLNVSVLPGLQVSGDGLRIFPPDNVVAAGAKDPLIAVKHFAFHSGLIGLFIKPMHVHAVNVSGLQITVPPASVRAKAGPTTRHKGKIKIVLGTLICDNSRLVIAASRPDKDPKSFELQHIEMKNVGPNDPWRYDAVLINAVPKGEIRSSGTFGPWNTDTPGDSSVTGHYTFDHANLNPIKGIGGILSSVGDFKGQLDKIIVDGTAETPDFSLDTAKHPMHLRTRFHAIVDGTSGDTYLRSVDAILGNSHFTTSGAVVNVKGRGHQIDLDVDVPGDQLQDFLNLSVKTEPPVMSATITTKAKLQIPPGHQSVSQRMTMQGQFTLRNIHFTNPSVQDKVDMLSLRAQGQPEQAKPGATDVNSRMTGTFRMSGGALTFDDLSYSLPGAQINLFGVYSLDGQHFAFHGKVLTNASLPHMVDNFWASLALRAVQPFFRRKGGGAEIPVSITGTKSAPKFGLDLFGHH